jgi:signal transduction histidine kinase
MPELAAGGVEPALVERIGEARDVADVDYLTERVPAAFERAGDGIQRVATIVRAMREFAHHTPNAQDPIDLNEVIRNALVVATNAYKYHADVETDLGDLPPVIGNSSDLGQALLNLIVNAGDAVGEAVADSGRRGQIAIRSHQDGDHVAISISDTGCGIPPEVAARIFDPFFTTKAMGRGTGQGLGIVHSIIVERHGGSLTFTSEPGSGTTFHIRLPIEPAHSALPEPAVT